MTWFRVDDTFGTHPKVMAIPRAKRKTVVGLWNLAGCWCARQLTDGAFAAYMLDEWAGTRAEAQMLVDVGLWERTDEGYVFHDWTDWNPSREKVLAKRKGDAERQQRGREKQRVNRGVTPEVPDVSRRDTPRDSQAGHSTGHGGPDPSRPDPTVVPPGTTPSRGAPKSQRGAQRRRLPEDFRPDQKHIDLAQELGVNLRAEWLKFVDHWRSTGETKADWSATLNNWIRRAAERPGQRQEPRRSRPQSRAVEPAPPFMTPEQAAQWEREQRARQAAG